MGIINKIPTFLIGLVNKSYYGLVLMNFFFAFFCCT